VPECSAGEPVGLDLQRRDVHPMDEAEGYKRLLSLAEPTYTIEQIAAKVGKTPVYIATRLKLTELCDEVAAVFYSNDIGVGHAILLAKLPPEMQVQGLSFTNSVFVGPNRTMKRSA
jgi:ParB family chromosome partitioning protein